jgi:hypothetical protein
MAGGGKPEHEPRGAERLEPRLGSRSTWEELRERGEVLGADALAGKGGVVEVVASRGSIGIVRSTEHRQRPRHEGVRG